METESEDGNAQVKNADSMKQLEIEFNLKREAYLIGQLLFTEDGQACGPAMDGNGEHLEFFYSKVKLNEEDDNLQKQSQEISLREEISFEEPYLSYKLNEFDDRKLCIINLMKNCPQISIALGACQFVKFVDHSREFAEKALDLEMR